MKLQDMLLQRALEERGRSARFVTDHRAGTAVLETGRELGIVYPDSFFERTAKLFTQPKAMRFTFRGHMTPGRAKLLHAFKVSHPETLIQPSEFGRLASTKGAWDEAYFQLLAASEFGLCPHQPDDGFEPGTLWTYRFVECCMVGAIPVQFRATPLNEAFTEGATFAWDDDRDFVYSPSAAHANRKIAEERWRLP